MSTVHSCEFEVFGKVQGVYFRRHAEIKAKTLGLRGWCMNTADGTVKGYIEGPRNEVNLMKEWLRNTGSPTSNIVKAEFTRDEEKRDYGFKNFQIRPDAPKEENRKMTNRENKMTKWEEEHDS
ncbi:acylphosphatase-1-like [Drosophila novamexicana]|uniref:acylphosphatase-1-like n=1 Tax=Drosophila novamexicana TaxID=47314 RepID=UPI0011E5D1ED|nr:acylphosphatase-1-like [Drosophila novamexicana]